jgi:hypothetical protein
VEVPVKAHAGALVLVAIVVLLALAVLLSPAEAQQAGKTYRIGYLNPASATLAPIRLHPLRDGLRELGYVEGRNVVDRGPLGRG